MILKRYLLSHARQDGVYTCGKYLYSFAFNTPNTTTPEHQSTHLPALWESIIIAAEFDLTTTDRPVRSNSKGGRENLISWRGKGVYTSLVTFYVYTSSDFIYSRRRGGGQTERGGVWHHLQFLLFNWHADKQMKKISKFLFVEGGGLLNVLLHQNFSS
jgi:hypothetical protein